MGSQNKHSSETLVSDKNVSRRSVLKASAAGIALGASASILPTAANGTAAASPLDRTGGQRNATSLGAAPQGPTSPYSTKVFVHGVASGDPAPNAVILWTRVTQQPTWTPGSLRGTPVKVKWEVCPQVGRSRRFGSAVRSGIVTTDKNRDFTVKVDATGLQPNTRYLYRFTVLDGPAAGAVSPVGATKTAPALNSMPERVRFAFLSCSNWEAGHYSTYRFLADRGDLDFVVHLGDWFYEYATGEYTGAFGKVREHEYKGETMTLEQYRRRHAHTKTDPDLQRCQAMYPFITVWDDHESADNSYLEGAVNHTEGKEGNWKARKRQSEKAYFEYMPTRVNSMTDGEHLYRYFRWGKLMDMSCLDLRSYRTKQNWLKQDNPDHTIGGAKQMQWLRDNIKNSTCLWKVIGNPVMMAALQIPPISPEIADFIAAKTGAPAHGIMFNSDQWDGYQWDRYRLTSMIAKNNIKNVVAVTGDIHMSFANDIYEKFDGNMKGRRVAVEFVGPSVTAANVDDILADKVGLKLPENDPLFDTVDKALQTTNQHIRWCQCSKHGYVVVEMNRKFAQADWFFVNNKSNSRSGQHWGNSWATNEGTSALYPVKKPLKF
ncbi:MAG: alkaline phosphatase D family protein [Lawsonella sp.]|uniref:alkaline phosphatase D family protein n=1 Tax=Lawsonella sp. TaxID=2041415 RepID=UPI00256BB159|nr:alkaline phosphatase D family protein [Lawsonella sp.]MBS6414602.1 alkaline phosphatase D family protein [Mycobacteriales bacterium]MDY2978704.1 alkaline phosphatase D family protein [Lawsonella sp.]